MERLPLIDVAEPERIAALTEAPDTVSFRADAAENLDGLVPDIGLTGKYPCRSVYRPRSFASAGLAATLTHRFWDTIDGTSDHTGRRWIGVVMYDEHGFDCRLEVTLGADPIGCMVPFRHDNRRHLYVLDRPVQFMGEMEVQRISGTGDAGYRTGARGAARGASGRDLLPAAYRASDGAPAAAAGRLVRGGRGWHYLARYPLQRRGDARRHRGHDRHGAGSGLPEPACHQRGPAAGAGAGRLPGSYRRHRGGRPARDRGSGRGRRARRAAAVSIPLEPIRAAAGSGS